MNNKKIERHFGVRQFPQVSHNPHTPSDQSSISHILFAQSNISYSSVLRNYTRNARFNTSSTLKPSLIVTPLHESHVQSTVICAKSIPIQIKIRSGGHDFEGISYISDEPFIVLDLFILRSISVDVQNDVAVVQSVDNVVDARIMDVNGRILDKDSMGEDLLWVIRGGGGGSFGVVLSYTAKLVRVPETVTVFRVERTLEQNATDLVVQWQEVAPESRFTYPIKRMREASDEVMVKSLGSFTKASDSNI
ncbi:berberine bridge enzyme-like 21 [Senna tora]|uniref:Berberine bridge enzyme-like 21 n=1 Tax=Senna tora TaxID=362788 RepID=A0A834WXZ8_9FABA|nr:berberine bridge enzyme-like 21 [Senna tora]